MRSVEAQTEGETESIASCTYFQEKAAVPHHFFFLLQYTAVQETGLYQLSLPPVVFESEKYAQWILTVISFFVVVFIAEFCINFPPQPELLDLSRC